MSTQIVITGSIQCGKSTLVRSVLQKLNFIVSGYLSQKRWNLERNGTEIWLKDLQSDYSLCFAFSGKDNKFEVDIDKFDSFLEKCLTQEKITNSRIICIDEIGFLEKNSKHLVSIIQSFSKQKNPKLIVIQKRVLQTYQNFFLSPDYYFYDLDQLESRMVQKEILALLNPK